MFVGVRNVVEAQTDASLYVVRMSVQDIDQMLDEVQWARLVRHYVRVRDDVWLGREPLPRESRRPRREPREVLVQAMHGHPGGQLREVGKQWWVGTVVVEDVHMTMSGCL